MIKDTNEIRKTIQEFFSKMGFPVDIKTAEEQEKTISIKIKTEEPKILIGQNGHTLQEIQHLLRLILRRKLPEDFYFDFDINDYKKKKIEYLTELAKSSADEVFLSKKEKTLWPMPAYERRIIHETLSDRDDVTTQSIGEEPDRKIVIKPSS